MKSDLRSVASLMESYYADHETYPAGGSNLIATLSPDLRLSAYDAVSLVSASGSAFCLDAHNSKASVDYFWDSSQGGLLGRGQSCS